MAATAHADDRAAAERYFRAGAQAYSAQNFGAAAADFDEAFKAMPLPEIAFSAAQAYRRLYFVDPKPEYVQRAAQLYRTYLDRVKTGGRVGDAADNLGEMQRELERLKISAAPVATPAVAHTRLGVSVTIRDQRVDTSALREIGDATQTALPGLAATLDGKPIEPFALVDVDAKDHVIDVRADGYQPIQKRAVAIAGQSQLIEVELEPKPATIAVKTNNDASIAVDGRPVATAPAAALDVPAGKHLLTIALRGHEPYGRELAVARGQALAIDAPLARTTKRRAVPWLYSAAGVLAAGAIATTIVAIDRDDTAGDLRAKIDAGNRPPSDADAYDAAVSSRDHFVDATWVLGAAAVAAAAVGVGLYFFDEPSADRLRVTPIATATTAGAAIVGHF
ncbi:MAG TPA: PEGA domain-containing protein [Kofleriaceae bacterium]|nr:PEGA domain-containing protein [Kofleriaceae bacterium]